MICIDQVYMSFVGDEGMMGIERDRQLAFSPDEVVFT